MKKYVSRVAVSVLSAALVCLLTACAGTIRAVSPASRTLELRPGESAAMELVYTIDTQVPGKTLEDEKAALAFAWSSDNEAVATVDAAGVVTAVDRGTAQITAQVDGVTGERKTVSYTVEVADKVEALSAEELSLPLNSAEGVELAITVTPKTAPRDGMKVEVLSEAAYARSTGAAASKTEKQPSEDVVCTATLQEDGRCLVKPDKAGVSYVIVTLREFTATAKVTVYEGLEELTAADLSLTVGRSTKVKITTVPANAEEGVTFTYESADPAIATVGANGNVTGIAAGTTTLTVTNEFGQTAAANISVWPPKAPAVP